MASFFLQGSSGFSGCLQMHVLAQTAFLPAKGNPCAYVCEESGNVALVKDAAALMLQKNH